MCEIFGRIILWLLRSVSFANWIEILKLLGAGVAFWIGLNQYRKSEAWKRLEFVAAEMKAFYDDAAVKLAMGMLDWRRKEVSLYKYRGENDFARETIDYAIVANALSTDPEKKYDKVHSAAREIFERFLEFLARFEGFLATGVVKQTDFDPYLDYWIKLIAGAGYALPRSDRTGPAESVEVHRLLWLSRRSTIHRPVRNCSFSRTQAVGVTRDGRTLHTQGATTGTEMPR
jgi:hypothetical protein